MDVWAGRGHRSIPFPHPPRGILGDASVGQRERSLFRTPACAERAGPPCFCSSTSQTETKIIRGSWTRDSQTCSSVPGQSVLRKSQPHSHTHHLLTHSLTHTRTELICIDTHCPKRQVVSPQVLGTRFHLKQSQWQPPPSPPAPWGGSCPHPPGFVCSPRCWLGVWVWAKMRLQGGRG